MATVNMRYDHPQYTQNIGASGVMAAAGAVGSGFAPVAFGAFCDSIVKAIHVVPLTAGTATAAASCGILLGYQIRNGTAVKTDTLITANGQWGTALNGTSILATSTLSRGDFYSVQSTGTDFTARIGVVIEAKPVPGASITS